MLLGETHSDVDELSDLSSLSERLKRVSEATPVALLTLDRLSQKAQSLLGATASLLFPSTQQCPHTSQFLASVDFAAPPLYRLRSSERDGDDRNTQL